MKILHTADIHLKDYQDNRWQALKEIIRIGKDQAIDLLIICGDLFDKRIDAEKLRDKIREPFSNNQFKIIIIPGNHDANFYEKGMYYGEDVVVLNDLFTPYEYKNLSIWGMPFLNIDTSLILENLFNLAKKVDKNRTNILLYHGELLDAFYQRDDFGDEGQYQYMPLKLAYFDNLKIDYVLSGHFHTNFDIRKLKSGGYFVYPGSPVSICKREIGKRSVNLFNIGEAPSKVEIDTFHFVKIEIKLDPFDQKNPLEKVSEEFEKLNKDTKVILKITGFYNAIEHEIKEENLIKTIKEITKEKAIQESFLFKDISTIINNDLFKDFEAILLKKDFTLEKKKRLKDLAIMAMMEIGVWEPPF